MTSRALVAALLGLLGAGCSSMKATVDINAPPETVWEVVSDLEHYHCWNPFFVRAGGTLREGNDLALTMQPVGKGAQSFSPEVLELEPGRRVVWRGRLLMPGLFDGRHVLKVDSLGATGTRFTQEESFGGVLVPFAGFEPYRAGWERMNLALKARAEALAASRPAAAAARPRR
ncbi:MAG TPA: SRPBCC domain-containing protein [Polyangiaceae bacterium]|nr:SRPBCC domain-containing protein [Polyangiaceae bacterium]